MYSTVNYDWSWFCGIHSFDLCDTWAFKHKVKLNKVEEENKAPIVYMIHLSIV